jgi:hypothetical protein
LLLTDNNYISKDFRMQFIKVFFDRFLYLPKEIRLSNIKIIKDFNKKSIYPSDLLLLNINDNLIIGITNQLLNENFEDKLNVYYDLLKQQFYDMKNVFLIYLTIDGRKPKYSKNPNIISLSWIDDIYFAIKSVKKSIKVKNKEIDFLLNQLDIISTIRTLPDNLEHPFDIKSFAYELSNILNDEVSIQEKSKDKIVIVKNNKEEKTFKYIIEIKFNKNKDACILESNNVKINIPFELKGKQVNYLIKNFLQKININSIEKVKLEKYFDIPFKEYQIYKYLQK